MLSESIHQWRIRKALEMYKKEVYSIGEASEFANVSHWEFSQLLKKYKIHVNYDTEEFEHDLKMIFWK
ncbi:UPF0175 family protein [Candidatus Woesearchaeota archaeon]|nr:UPF0175 family protein [Candidatus Woesearchaeota archaeon]